MIAEAGSTCTRHDMKQFGVLDAGAHDRRQGMRTQKHLQNGTARIFEESYDSKDTHDLSKVISQASHDSMAAAHPLAFF